jgi:Fe2+ or Zn2+ uptake regulation protein
MKKNNFPTTMEKLVSVVERLNLRICYKCRHYSPVHLVCGECGHDSSDCIEPGCENPPYFQGFCKEHEK